MSEERVWTHSKSRVMAMLTTQLALETAMTSVTHTNFTASTTSEVSAQEKGPEIRCLHETIELVTHQREAE